MGEIRNTYKICVLKPELSPVSAPPCIVISMSL
jgi:hypothetical protein